MVGLEHKQAAISAGYRLGDSSTYILVTPGSNKIEVFINGTKVHEWS